MCDIHIGSGYNLLSYPELTLFDVNINHYDRKSFRNFVAVVVVFVVVFVVVVNLDTKTGLPLKKSILIYSYEQNL